MSGWRRGPWRAIGRHSARNAPEPPAVEEGMEEMPARRPADQPFAVVPGPAVGDAPVLVHALSGFVDAGAARTIAVDHVLATLAHRTIATYDLDGSYDYRARRPRMVFEGDHFESVDLPEIVLSEVTDALGAKFLLLHGPEPDMGWQRFVQAVLDLIERFDVRMTVGVNAIPWGAPHTRPIGVTAHATSPDLIAGRPSVGGTIEVPGHVGALLELTLGKAGKPAMGFAIHVPHYLTGAEHPRSALAMLQNVASATGLAIPLEGLERAADETDSLIDSQVRANPENVEAIKVLEAQYDAAMAQTPDAPITGVPLPSGDEIAAQLEDFLRDLGDSPQA